MRAEKLSGCDPPLLSAIPILIIIEQLTLRLVCTHGWVVCLSSKTQRAPIKESDKEEEERICDDNDEAIQCLPPSNTDGAVVVVNSSFHLLTATMSNGHGGGA